MGVLSPIGQGVEAFWSSLLNGVSGITAIERFPTHDLRVRRGGEVKQAPRHDRARTALASVSCLAVPDTRGDGSNAHGTLV